MHETTMAARELAGFTYTPSITEMTDHGTIA
jgi:hypothetical protein